MVHWEQTALTLIVNANMTTIGVVECDRTKASHGRGFDFRFASLPWVPALAFGIAVFLEEVLGVNVVHADLRTPSGRATET
jgi:hypothetical protein